MQLNTFLNHTDNLFKDCRDTLVSKNHDYSNTDQVFSNFIERHQITGIETERLFLNDIALKISRIKNLIGKEAQHESMEDSVQDLINYAVLFSAYLEYKKSITLKY